MNSKIAIVMPVYKAEKFLEESLECLINQSLKDIIIICVNDASPDNSKAILDAYANKDSRIVVINHEENKGAAISRNDGLDYIFTNLKDIEYIAFFDADDKIEPDAYEIAYNQAKVSDADIVNFNFLPNTYWQYKTDAISDVVDYNGNCIQSIFDYKEFYTFIVCWSKIYKKELLQNIRFPEQKFFEDGGFAYKVFMRAKKLRIIPNTLYQYNIENPNSTCGEFDEMMRIKNIFKTMRDTLNDWESLGVNEKYKYDFIKHILLYTSLVCPNILESNYGKELSDNLDIDIDEELLCDNLPDETKLLLRKMTTKKENN